MSVVKCDSCGTIHWKRDYCGATSTPVLVERRVTQDTWEAGLCCPHCGRWMRKYGIDPSDGAPGPRNDWQVDV